MIDLRKGIYFNRILDTAGEGLTNYQGAKKVTFTALQLVCTSPKVNSASLKKKFISRIDYSSAVI